MSRIVDKILPAELIPELEKRYFWWKPLDSQSRTPDRILAQAMDLATFADIRKLEIVIGRERLAQIMRHAQPGWLSDRSWELWRGRLSLATGQPLPEEPPRRPLHAAAL